MTGEGYLRQVALLVRVLPIIAREPVFALKGGTAINLFLRDLPRLSVDIDLTFLPVKERAASLGEIDEVFERIAAAVQRQIPGATVQRTSPQTGADMRLLIQQAGSMVKVETSPVARGVVHKPSKLEASESVQAQFGFVEVQAVSFEDLFAGKMAAALDRQHPRDLYDIKLLFEEEGVSEALFRTFLVYAASSSRPLHELLAPNLKDLEQVYAREFVGMTRLPVGLDDLHRARTRLIREIHGRMDESAARFLLSIHDADPAFDLLDLPQAGALPAVRWKQQNLQRLLRENPKKHAAQRDLLKRSIQTQRSG